MKKILVFFLAGVLLLGSAGCRLYSAGMLDNGDLLSGPQTDALISAAQSRFQKPPNGTLYTPDGEVELTAAGYHWTAQNSDGTAVSTIADQADRPLSRDSLKPVKVSGEYAETVYAPAPGSDDPAPTNSLGYLMKLSWEVEPSSVSYTCWSEAIWKNSSVRQEAVACQGDLAFYAKPGGYIYEITATWDDVGVGYHGTANYYVYIVGIADHSHQPATEAQTVADPVTGYCGNTQTTLHIGDKEYSFMYGQSVTLTDILVNLNYDPMRVCRCRPEYIVDTEFGTGYGVNLTAGYARCDKGQADLTQEQVDAIAEIIEWAETTNCTYPMED